MPAAQVYVNEHVKMDGTVGWKRGRDVDRGEVDAGRGEVKLVSQITFYRMRT